MIRVDPGAQQTDAFQESRNLLLSNDAHADAIPGLEIEADDVRCTHAAAVAQIDPEQLYYLRSRGLSDEAAKQLVVEGFLGELVERAPEGPAREELAERAERRLAELLARLSRAAASACRSLLARRALAALSQRFVITIGAEDDQHRDGRARRSTSGRCGRAAGSPQRSCVRTESRNRPRG